MAAKPSVSKIGRYEIVSEIGRGGMGVVYLAKDPIIDRTIALKTIRRTPDMSEDFYAVYVERFLREARAAGNLQHPSIVGVYDAGTDPDTGQSYLAMEFIEGASLEEKLQQGSLFSTDEVCTIGIRAAEALSYAHSQGIVHRDIKPANLLVDTSGDLKILDFGVAKLPESSLTRTGQIIGTPHYMSPEQVTGSQVDHRSDLFSLGVVLYQIATGTKPFTGDSFTTIAFKIMHDDPPPLRISNPHVSETLERVLLKSLSKNPAERHQDGQELAADLRAAQSGACPDPSGRTLASEDRPAAVSSTMYVDETKPRAAAPPGKRSVIAKRLKILLPVAAAVLLAIVVLVVVMVRSRDAASPETPSRVTPTLTGEEQETIARLLKEGNAFYQKENYPECIARMEQVLGIEPDNALAKEYIELSRKAIEARVTGGKVLSEPEEEAQPSATPGLEAAEPETDATMIVKFAHHISSGVYTIYVDDEELYTGALRARKTKRILPGVKVSKEDISKTLTLPPGQHRITVHVIAQKPKIDKRKAVSGTFKGGQTRILHIEVHRVTKQLEVFLY